MNTENAGAQMRKGVLDLCVLRVVGQGEAYASDISEALRKADQIARPRLSGGTTPFRSPFASAARKASS